MRWCYWGIRASVLLMLAVAGCAGEKSDGQMLTSADDAAAAPAEEFNAGPHDEFPLTDAGPEFTAAPGSESLQPSIDIAASESVAMMSADPPPAPSASDDWPQFAPRQLPSGSAYRSVAPTAAPRHAPRMADAMPAPVAAAVDRPIESIEHVDEAVSRLDYGTVGFYTPTELPWGETFVQEVVLSPKDTPEELRAALSNPTAPAEFSRLQVANRMEARLTGSGFDIEPLSEALQAITSHRPTKWRFKVTPVKTGPQELHLSLLAHIDIDGRDAPLVVETKDAQIEVDITVPQRLAGMFQAHWKWLWAAVIVPTIGYFWRRKTGRKPPEQPIRHARAA